MFIRIAKHLLQIDFLATIRACLFLSDDAPTPDAKLVKSKAV